MGFIAQAFEDEDANKQTVKPEYEGLKDKKIAVLVAADEYVLFEYPDAPRMICLELSKELVRSIPGTQVIDPRQVHHFQISNPYWNSTRYSDLMSQLRVDRLIFVDLLRYATHEPGNPHLKRGTMAAHIGVAEVEAENPDNFVYSTTVEARFPGGNPIGRVDSDDTIVTLGLQKLFAVKIGNLFREYVTGLKKE